MLLVESCAFDVLALMRMFGVKDAPPSLLKAPQNCASSLGMPSVSPLPPRPRSLRESYQTTARFPLVGSSEIFGRNWLFTVRSSLTRTASLQVAPPSSEERSSMSVSSLSFGCSSVYTRYTRPLFGPPVRSQAK